MVVIDRDGDDVIDGMASSEDVNVGETYLLPTTFIRKSSGGKDIDSEQLGWRWLRLI